jgi:eukaryotic-like serine/threonine-protein kinase
MTPQRWRQIETLYHAALDRAPVERPAFLNEACNGDSGLRRQIEELLGENSERGAILDKPPWHALPSSGAPLATGAQLGPYRIEAVIGKGGMGEVYRARDTRLQRSVAIKVSAAQFSERFEREARAIAALNHPNICQIYDVGPNYLVMELIEGESPKGPLPAAEVERIALQIADALDAAHEKGITHRDLKPGNIKITPEGTVKVLDFGLAKVTEAREESRESPPAMAVTEPGMILGTAAYMAPEQARGKAVDKHADVWAFGVVVWELLTGERLFQGESTVDVLSKVLNQTFDFQRVPEKFRKLLMRCLERNPRDRLRDIGEARFLLEESPVAAPVAPVRMRWLWPSIATVATVAAFVAGSVAYRHSTEEPPVAGRFAILIPEKKGADSFASVPAISPDGRRLAIALTSGQQTSLWVRDLNGENARMLPGTGGASYPFWSPDGRSLGFFAGGKLLRMEPEGDSPRTLCDVPTGRGGTWSRDDVIVYGTIGGGLFRVSAAGGIPVALTRVDTAAGENNHRTPWFLPDGKRFLYTSRHIDAAKTRIYVDSIDARPGSSSRKEVLTADSNAVYAPAVPGSSKTGYLLFVREGKLMAQAFDPDKASTTGDAVPVAERVDYYRNTSQANFAASRGGTLVYMSGGIYRSASQLTWFNRLGKQVGTVGMTAVFQSPRISPDGSKLSTDPMDAAGSRDIWVHDIAKGTASRLTFGPGASSQPVWSGDGSRIAFSRAGGGAFSYVKATNGVGAEEPLDQDPRPSALSDWSRDGRYLIKTLVDPKNGADLWVIPQFGDRKLFPYASTEYQERLGRFSPDAQWVAYTSDESKRTEIYVQTFPEQGGKWQISTSGGDFPVWSRDGRELYFIGVDRKLMAVDVKGSGKNLQAGAPKALFEVPLSVPFDVSSEGRFLIQAPVNQGAASVPLTVITNWQAGLKK